MSNFRAVIDRLIVLERMRKIIESHKEMIQNKAEYILRSDEPISEYDALILVADLYDQNLSKIDSMIHELITQPDGEI